MSLTMFQVIDLPEGQDAITAGVDEAIAELRPDLATGLLCGTQLAYNVAVKRRSNGDVRLLNDGFFDSGVPDPENGAYDYVRIAEQKRDVSLRTGLSMRDTITRGLLDHGDVEWIGNVVVFLDTDGVYLLIISCSGLNDIGDEAAAELFASKIKRKLLIAQRQLELAA